MANKKQIQVSNRRCAIYTRKSTREGLDQDFSSVDAQREAGENFVNSQAGEGWHCLPDRYDDGGYTGANMDRPALKRLFQDIDDGKVDCIVVYKVDRLSRSIMDFLSMIEDLEERQVSFVSVTQHFDTRTSLGRLVLNILLSFAQFEREMISERTRDKIAATRRRGKWTGGRPVLGYDVLSEKIKLEINDDEAKKVKAIYALYLKEEGLLATLRKMNELGYRNKRWVTRKGNTCGGSEFSKNTLHRLLTNVLYIGKITYKEEIHEGEHPGIIDPEVFQRVQVLMKRNSQSGGAKVREKSSALLKGLLYCVPCKGAMTPNFTTKKNKRYRYYTCLKATKEGWDSCPAPSVPANEIERVVIDQIRCFSQDPAVVSATVKELQQASKKRKQELKEEEKQIKRQLNSQYKKLNEIVKVGCDDPASIERMAILQEDIDANERRITDNCEELVLLSQEEISKEEAIKICKSFEQVWEALTFHERANLLKLLVERIEYDGSNCTVSVKFYPTCIKALSDQFSDGKEE